MSLDDRAWQRVSDWQLRTRWLSCGIRPLLMGIINVTPDSFSDGGEFVDADAAINHGLELVSQGADILDVGGESTRPYSTPVSLDEELRRTIPVVQGLCGRVDVPVSIDTSKAEVARQAIAAGAEIVNDVTGFEGDAAMIPLAVASQVGVCAMHMRGSPQTMQDDPTYGDVVAEILYYLRTRRDGLIAAGAKPERICLDPGIGFGKSHEHNLALLANCWRFHELDCPLLVGHSRKGFIHKVLGNNADLTAGTIGVALSLAGQGVQVIRVHDVSAVRQALLLFEAAGGLERCEL